MSQPPDTLTGVERLLPAKLVPPLPPAWAVTRSTLLDQLDAVRHNKMVTLTAPPGFGKTTVMAQWARRNRPSSTAWLSLDRYDNSALMLLRYLVATFAGVEPGMGERAARLLESDPLSAVHLPATLLLSDIATSPRPLTLILDDIDRITDTEALELLNLLVERSPAKLGFIVAGTHCRPIRPQTLLSQGRLHRIESRHLRFAPHEANALVKLAGVEEEGIEARLIDESDGWVTGMRLLLSARIANGNEDATPPHIQPRQDIHEFFRHSVLPRLPEPQVEFLLSLSALDRFNAPLANAALERSDAEQMIEWLDAQGVFIQRLDASGDWYRLDHLAHSFFSQRLSSKYVERYRQINLNAAHWLLAHGFWHDAVARAMAASAEELAAQWLAQRAMGLIESSDLRSVKDCLRLLPSGRVATSAPLLLAQAWAHTLSLETHDAERSLNQLETLCATAGPDATSATMQLDMQAIRAMHRTLRDDSNGGCDIAQEVLAHHPTPGSWTWRMARTAEVVGLIYRGDFKIIERLEASVMTEPNKARKMPAYARVYTKSVLGLGHLIRGELARAEHVLSRAYRLAVDAIGPESAAAALPTGYLSAIYYDWERFDTLDQLFAQHELSVVCTTAVGAAARYASTKIRRLAQIGAHDEAMAVVETANRLAFTNGWSRMYCYVQNEVVRLSLANDALKDASMAMAAMAAEWSPGPKPPAGTELESWALYSEASARLALARYQPDEAIARLAPLIETLTTLGMNHLCLTPRLLMAIALQARGDEQAALDSLETTLLTGAAGYATRPFIDAPEGMRALIFTFVAQRLAQRPQLSWFVQSLLSAFDAVVTGAHIRPGQRASSVDDPLTPREQDILEALCEGLSNKQLAGRLQVSQETVKWHLKNIYAKLGIGSRSQAIILGHELVRARSSAMKRK